MELKDVQIGMKVKLLGKPMCFPVVGIENFYSLRARDECVKFFQKKWIWSC